jgi:hypothetical protein
VTQKNSADKLDVVSYTMLSQAMDCAYAIGEKPGEAAAKAAFTELAGNWISQSMVEPIVQAVMVRDLDDAIERLRDLQRRIVERSIIGDAYSEGPVSEGGA